MHGLNDQRVDPIPLVYGPKGKAAAVATDARETAVVIGIAILAITAGAGALLILVDILLNLTKNHWPGSTQLFMLLGLAGLGALLALTGRGCIHWLRRRPRDYWLYCEQCGYDLRANQDHCPECGAFIAPWRVELVRRAVPPETVKFTNADAARRLEEMCRGRSDGDSTNLER